MNMTNNAGTSTTNDKAFQQFFRRSFSSSNFSLVPGGRFITFLASATEVTECAKHLRFGHWCFFGRKQAKVWYPSCSIKPNGAWDRIARQLPQKFEEASHPIFYSVELFSKGDLNSKKGKQTIHFQSTTQTKKPSSIVLFWCAIKCAFTPPCVIALTNRYEIKKLIGVKIWNS